MMNTLHPQSEYYLHENGKLIFKPHGGVDATSPFVRRVWRTKPLAQSPVIYAEWLLDAYKSGALASEINRLAQLQRLFDFMPELKPEFERLGIIQEEETTCI